MVAETTRRSGGRPHVVVLGGGSPFRASGISLRWRALQEALGRHTDCTFREIGCHRAEQCLSLCQLTGEPNRDDPVSYYPHDDVIWSFDRTACERYASHLAEEFAAAGVSTVVCSGLETHRYVRALAGVPGLTVIFDMHNVELALHRELHQAAPPGSYYSTLFTEQHLRLVEEAERAAVAAADALWVCSRAEQALVAALYDDTAPERTTVVPNAVDVPDSAAPAAGCERICYTGRLDYYPNMDAAWTLGYEIAPLLRAGGHEVPVVVAGAYAQEILGGPTLPPGVDLVSSPASIADVIAGGVMAVPLTVGGGTRFKILEAFAYGAPVVSTAKGAEGLDAVPGVHYLNAESPAEFAESLGALIGDPALRDRLGGAAWQLVRDRYSIDALARQLGEVVGALPPVGARWSAR